MKKILGWWLAPCRLTRPLMMRGEDGNMELVTRMEVALVAAGCVGPVRLSGVAMNG